ncbi:MAG: TonB-dependent receptor [Sphingobacteriaceae bacterium]|nr:MAG: TonB-dependent receptor [Sphingobacteriaceae bacterium]
MKLFSTLIIALIISFTVSAQTTLTGKGKITGKVTDALTKKPVDYATISVFLTGKTQPITGGTTNEKGVFSISQIPIGVYSVAINFIGYERYNIAQLTINDAKNSINLNTILLKPTATTLKEVNVTARLPTVENRIDKMIYNAANDLTSQGGVALDVLKKVPQVTVDIDGNVELQGNPNVRFLINGKPSSIFGNSLADALASIPASQIKSIEVITSPGAKYDAEGTGGIINIILKDNNAQGINGNVNLSAGTRQENGSANLNIKRGNFGVSAFFSGNAQINTRTLNSNNRTSADAAGNLNLLTQNGYNDFRRNGYQGGLSFDWALTKKDNLTASLGYNHFGNRSSGLTDQEQLLQGTSDIFSLRNSTNQFNARTYDWNLNYKKTFAKEGQELNILYSASSGNNQSQYNQVQNYAGVSNPFSASNSVNPGTDKQTNISVDYVQPIAKSFVAEAGIKTVLQTINSSADVNTLNPVSGVYAHDATQSYELYYNRKIYAGYLSASFSAFSLFDVKVGSRYEHTNTEIDFPGTPIPSYNTIVPSAVVSHKFGELQSLKISYTKRIERPDYREINPFTNRSDPYNISTGNPALKPEVGNIFELGHNRSFESGGNLYIALFSRHNSNDIKPYTNFYTDYRIGDSVYHNVSVSNRQNIGTEQNTGINISGSFPLGKKLNLRTNTFVTDRYIVNKVYGGTTINAVVFRVNLNATYQFSNNLIAEAFGNYNSASTNIQGRMPQFITYNFAMRKQFLNKKASFGFTTTNPFAKYVNQVSTITQSATTNGQLYSSYNLRQIPFRSFGISLAYKFGKLEFKKEKEETNGAAPIEN